MDLKGNQITLGELWDRPASRAVFKRRVPILAGYTLKVAARTITLGQLADFLGGLVPGKLIDGVLDELRRV